MTDRAINLGCVVAYLLWAAVVMFLLAGLLMENEHVGQVGLATAAAAATATVRSYFVKSNQIMRNALALRSEADRVSSIR